MRRDWSLGPVFVLRHAGMPFDWLEGLGAGPALLAAADEVLARADALLAAAAAGGRVPQGVEAAVRRLEPALLPRTPAGWGAAADRWSGAVRRYLAAFEDAQEAATAGLAALLRRSEVQEAVHLSNPDVHRNMLEPFLARGGPLNAARRRARRQLYTYLQRFCAKNETVSFFGPMGYGRTVPGDRVALRTGLPRRREVFLASWAARELAAAIAGDPRLRTVLPFRPTGRPAATADGTAALRAVPADGAALPALAAALGRPLRETAVRLGRLVAQGALEFGVAAGPYDLDPLGTMLDGLGRMPEAASRTSWPAVLRELRGLLAEVADTPFPARTAVVARLEDAFTAATGKPARRGAGAVYADRAVFYEECSSPFALEVGEGVAAGWARALAAALELSTAHGAEVQTAARRRVIAALGAAPGGDAPDAPVELTFRAYAERLSGVFDPGGSRFAADHVPRYPAAGAEKLTAQMVAAAQRLPGDRYAVIDLCPAAADTDGLAGAELVLGRCHHHLLTDGWLATMAPDREAFGRSAAEWLAGHPHVVGLDVGRRNKGYYRFPGTRVPVRHASHADGTGVLWPEQLTVTLSGAERWPTARRPDGSPATLYIPLSDHVKYPPYAALSEPQVAHAAFDGTGPCPAGTPPVRVGGVVYQRPRWTLPAEPFAAPSPATRFLALRRFAATPGAGRFVFCRTDRERKPYLVDLASVLAADLLGYVAGRARTLAFEQMLPGPDALWLRDAEGRRYTCELRVQMTGRDRQEAES
ncbi:lantibiotic dehydratase [Streptomyces sp. NPDC021224]|uniref:lantibiotic dehydratase n=1 Tax=unclassified Streptomyces TaxID=2593676 RepID=UPI0037A54626